MTVTEIMAVTFTVWALWAIACTALERAKTARSNARNLHKANCELRAQMERNEAKNQLAVDDLERQIAVKDCLLRQRWRDAV